MKTFKKYLCITLTLALMLTALMSFNVNAKSPYNNYFIASTNSSENILPTPESYELKQVVDFPDTASGKLQDPKDIFVGPDQKIYIADAGNNRVVVLKPDLTLDFIITGSEDDGSKLKSPSCVFVDKDGTILVCDYGNKRLIEFTKYGNFRFAYPTPASDLLSKDFNYQPQRVLKDNNGYIYVCNLGDSNGIMLLSSSGEFKSYYGTNRVSLSLWESIARLLWSREDRLGSVVTLPYTFNNIFISDGYIYATTTGYSNAQLRKINPGGSDVVYSAYDFTDKGLLRFSRDTQNFIDVTVDNDFNMFIIDSVYGRIYEYDEQGRNLFVFGNNGIGKGQFANPVSIEIDNQNRLFVLNGKNGTINVYKATDFANLVHKANKNYYNGIYTPESNPSNPDDNALTQWEQVRKEDNFYVLATQSIGLIKWRLFDYKTSYDLFIEAEDATNASNSFIELRADFLGEYFSIIATVVVLLLVGLLVLKSVRRKYRLKHPVDPDRKGVIPAISRFFGRIGNIARHPVDGFEDIRYEGKGSYSDAFIIMGIYLVTEILSKIFTSFIYRNGQSLDFIKWNEVILWAILPWIVVGVCNYGVTTIMFGEGRFRDVVIGGAYCHVPFIFIHLPLAIITQVLSLQEKQIYNLVTYLAYAWVIILVFFCIKGIHGMNPLRALVTFIITAVGVALVCGLYLIVYGLASQLIDFIVQFAKELSYIVG